MFTLPLAPLLPGPTELALIGGIIVILFGASKLPELARSFGRAQTEYEKAKREGEAEIAAMKQGKASPGEDPEKLAKLRAAAEALGIETEGKNLDELRAAIARATSET